MYTQVLRKHSYTTLYLTVSWATASLLIEALLNLTRFIYWYQHGEIINPSLNYFSSLKIRIFFSQPYIPVSCILLLYHFFYFIFFPHVLFRHVLFINWSCKLSMNLHDNCRHLIISIPRHPPIWLLHLDILNWFSKINRERQVHFIWSQDSGVMYYIKWCSHKEGGRYSKIEVLV